MNGTSSSGAGSGPGRALPCACVLIALACAPPKQTTTQLAGDDLLEMSARMAGSLAADAAIAGRTASSPRWIFSFQAAENLTEHPFRSADEQWLPVARLRLHLSGSRVLSERNIAFVLPREEWLRLGPEGPEAVGANPLLELRPTHLLQPVFRSDTRSTLKEREDYFFCEFKLIDLATRETIWIDSYEIHKRVLKSSWKYS
jgi:hypothetical protein